MRSFMRNKLGFTFIEVVVVTLLIAILAVVLSFKLPENVKLRIKEAGVLSNQKTVQTYVLSILNDCGDAEELERKVYNYFNGTLINPFSKGSKALYGDSDVLNNLGDKDVSLIMSKTDDIVNANIDEWITAQGSAGFESLNGVIIVKAYSIDGNIRVLLAPINSKGFIIKDNISIVQIF